MTRNRQDKLSLRLFYRLTKQFAGRGLRKNIPLLNQIYLLIKRHLTPEYAIIQGHRMKLDAQDSLNLSINGVYEPYQTALIKQWAKPGYSVLDIGANIGYYTLLLAGGVGSNGRVFAFEPEPTMSSILAENVRLNNYSNVVVLQEAVSNRNGVTELYADEFSNLDYRIYKSKDGGKKSIPVETIRLDSVAELNDHKINLIKMDIQGSECGALQGMGRLLKKSSELVLFTEFWPLALDNFGTPPAEFFDLLKENEFKIYEINEGEKELQLITTLDELLLRCRAKPNNQTNLFCVKEG